MKVKFIKLFGLIPFFKLWKQKNKVKGYLFNKIHIFKTIEYHNSRHVENNSVLFEMLSDMDSYKEALAIDVTRKTVLLVEPNLRFHSECLPGYIKYLNDLNFDVHVLLGNENIKLNCFSELKNCNFKLFGFNSYETILTLIGNPIFTDKYHKIIVTTSLTNYGNFIANEWCDNDKILYILHSLNTIKEFSLKKMAKMDKFFVLSYFENNNIRTLNPHYFGDIQITDKNTDTVEFVSVGRIDKDVKNYDLLINTIKKLKQEGLTNFKINVVGWFGNIDIPDEIKDHIVFHGKVDFPTLYRILEKSDFVLSLLDPENEKHLLYTTDLITGTNQLVLGFKKLYLINEVYAKTYKYNSSNAIVYSGNDLYSAMKEAITMNADAYKQKQENLKDLDKALYNLSLNNLKEKICQ